MLAKLRPFVWEKGIAKSFVSTRDVHQLLDVPEYFRLTKQKIPGDMEEVATVLAHDSLISKDVGGRWNIFNLGAALFASDVSQFEGITRKVVRVVRYSGITRSDTAKEWAGNKGYAVGFDALAEFVNEKLPKEETIRRSLRFQRPLYPKIAIRELIANALLHQDMTISGTGPLIEIFIEYSILHSVPRSFLPRLQVHGPGRRLCRRRAGA